MFKDKIYRILNSANVSSLAGNLIFAVSSLCTFLLMVRNIDKVIFGQWIIFITVASLLDMFRLGLTGTAAIRLISILSDSDSHKGIGASYQLSILSTLTIGLLFYVLYFPLKVFFPESNYLYVLFFYPLLSLANLPYQQANVVAQGQIRFKNIIVLRLLNGGTILLLLFIYLFIANQIKLEGVINVYIAGNLISSLFTMYKSWDGIRHIRKGTQELRKNILEYGKYSTGSYIGSNLLKSSDTIILSLAPFLGAEAIAIYAIPLKFVEVVEIPLRSFSATAFPKFSQAIHEGKEKLKKILFSYVLGTTILLIPFVIILFVFSDFFLQLLGGEVYRESIVLQQSILYIIGIYILLLPIDRYTGVALMAINKPKLNFVKIFIMLIANILVDLLAVFVFHSLIYVAGATLFFTLVGIVVGRHFLSDTLGSTYTINPKFRIKYNAALNLIKNGKFYKAD